MAESAVIRSGYVECENTECSGCSRCLMACSAYHSGAVAPQLSSIKWVATNFLHGLNDHYPLFCGQCDHPECYFACPQRDIAICIDQNTGARYINRPECTGCGACIEACPFEPPRINFDDNTNVAIKCDLCKDRPQGPVCIEICDRGALTFTSKEKR
jgi:Fe-S-cluster-containing hydrogenase component 2